MKRPWSLRTYLLILAVAVIVPFAGLLAYLIVKEAQQAAAVARETALVLARRTANRIRAQITRSEEALERNAIRPIVQAMNPAQRPQVLDKVLENNRQFASLYVVTPTGEVIHSMPRQTNGLAVSFAESAWFGEMLRREQMTISPPTFDPLSGKWIALLACPIRDESSGKPTGGLCGSLDLVSLRNVLTNAFTNALLLASGVVTVLDGQGTVVTRSADPERWVAQSVQDTEIARAALTNAEGRLTARGEDGLERLYGFVTLNPAGWHVLVGLPHSAALASVRADVSRSIFLALGVVGLALVLAIWLSRRIARPIQALARAANEVAQGRWDLRLPLTGPAEIAIVAQEFNGMTAARRTAEETLRATEAKFRTLAEKSLTGVYIVQGGQFVYVNPRLAEIFGYHREEMIGLNPVLNLVAPEDRERVQESLRQRLTGEVESRHYSWRGLRKDGTLIDVEVFGTRIELHGQPAVIGTLIDITERKQAEDAMRHARDFAETLIRTASVMIVGLDTAGKITVFNEAAEKLTGYRRAELEGKNWFEVLVPKDRYPYVWEEFERLLAGGLPELFENPILTKSGEERLISWSNNEVHEGGRIVGTISFGLDLTERKRIEAALRRVNRALKVLSEVNQELVRTGGETELLHKISQIIVTKGGYRLAWIGLAEPDERKSVRPVAQAGFEEGYLETVNITWADEERGRGPTGTAIRTGKPAVVQNLLADPSYAPWLAEATKRGYASSASLPLLADGKAFGALSIYAPEPDAFDAEEMELLMELANDLAFGIKALRLEAERQRTETALRLGEEKYRSLIEQAVDGIFLLNAQGRFLDANPQGCRMAGFSREEFLKMEIKDTIAPEELPRVPPVIADLMAGQTVTSEWRCVRKDGSFFPGEIRSRMLPDGRILTILRDVSERKRSEEALRQAEVKYRTLVENIPAITYMASPDEVGSVFFVSPQVEILGFPRQEWTLNPDLRRQLIHPDDRERIQAEVRKSLAAGEFHCEYRLLARDGRTLWFRDDAVVVRDDAGHPLYVQGVLLDITGLKLAEKAVRAVSGRLLSLQEAERRRIARELHDTTAQNLTALTMNLSVLKSAVPQTNSAGAKALDECFRLTNQCVEEIRTFSYLLHPPVLEELGLARALHDYAAGFQQRSGIKVELDLSVDGGALPKEAEMTLFRVVQESLGNIHRHSGSRKAAIRMWREGREVWLEVQDAGHGIPPEQLQAIETGAARFGVGIAGMRERMQQLGGRLAIRSGAQGTTVQAIVPVGANDPQAGASA